MGLLIRLQHLPQSELRDFLRHRDVPEIPLELERAVFGPQFQDDVHRLEVHQPLCARIRQIEQRPVGRYSALPEADVDPPSGQVIEIGEADRYVRRVMLRHDGDPRAQTDPLRLRQDVGDEQVVGGNRLPHRGMVLADPGLGESELLGPQHALDIFFECLGAVLLRRMQWHHERSDFHFFVLPNNLNPLPVVVLFFIHRLQLRADRSPLIPYAAAFPTH